MFGNNFNPDHVIGMFNYKHFLLIIAYFLIIAVTVYYLAKKDSSFVNRFIKCTTIYIVGAEIIKSLVKIIRRQAIIGSISFAFCSLFIPALLLSLFKNEKIKRLGYSYLGFGAIIGGSFFISYPNGLIDYYPLYHIVNIHSMTYHMLMVIVGLIILIKKIYTPTLKDFKYYFCFMTFFSIFAVIDNYLFNHNSMFLANPCGVMILQDIADQIPWLYTLLAYLGESIILFFPIYYFYHLIKKHSYNELLEERASMP